MKRSLESEIGQKLNSVNKISQVTATKAKQAGLSQMANTEVGPRNHGPNAWEGLNQNSQR